jgi:hypothetical protein
MRILPPASEKVSANVIFPAPTFAYAFYFSPRHREVLAVR